uniref:Uncharacterized protein n=1 Tax=candidate division WOR-3 bacterium TaxID=2052148 RepID=A0A7C2P308_UNCW3
MGGKYRNFIKPLNFKKSLEKLVPENVPFCKLESEELEGYPGCFCVGYFSKEILFHPTNGELLVVHPYDELLIFAGSNPQDILDLGAKIIVFLGEEREKYVFSESSVVIIPKGMPHGPIKIESLKRPIIHFSIICDVRIQYDFFSARKTSEKSGQYKKFVKRLTTSKSAYEGYISLSTGKVKIDERGVMDLSETGPGEAYQIIQMHPEDLEGVDTSFSWEFCRTPGVWMSTRYAHVHPEPELLVALSLDVNDLNNLGASLEFWFGTEREVYVIDKPSLITIPRPWIPHTPLITQRVERPFGFILTCPGVYTRAAYVETGYDVF